MLKHMVNHLRIELSIWPDGPLLIKANDQGSGLAKMNFVRTRRNRTDQVYLPGSSLKGALRAHAERISRSLREDSVCNPFHVPGNNRNPSPWGVPNCHTLVTRKGCQDSSLFKVLCPACQVFGSLSNAGRFNISDAYLENPDQTQAPEVRDHVSIDRFTGGSLKGALMNNEAQTDGRFKTQISLENITWWQLAWIGLVLRDLEDGFIAIGAGSSRGMGQVKAKIGSMDLDLIGSHNPYAQKTLPCLGDSFNDAEAYGYYSESTCELPESLKPIQVGLRHRLTFSGDQVREFFQKLAPRFAQHLDKHPDMQNWRKSIFEMDGLVSVCP